MSGGNTFFGSDDNCRTKGDGGSNGNVFGNIHGAKSFTLVEQVKIGAKVDKKEGD